MKTWIYSWLIYPSLYAVATIVGLFNEKIRDTLRLRSWKDFLSLRYNVGQPIDYWVHVASSGELEYAIPILQELDRRRKRVLVTYYSISAKVAVEQLPRMLRNVSLVVPLPHDGLGLMKEFVTLARRQGVHHLLLMKYELWPGLLWECNAHGIKVLLVDALKPGWFHRRLLHKLDAILSGYASEIVSIDHRNVRVVGDTRVERVLERIENSRQRLDSAIAPEVRSALTTKPVLVCGSMWPPDNSLVVRALDLFKRGGGDCHIIWVPHELDERECKRVSTVLLRLGYQVRSIEDAVSLSAGSQAIIVMKKGILAELYRLGQGAFVGGGFGSGVHSVWEPALAGLHVACGPRTERSPEAMELAKRGRLVRATSAEQLSGWMHKALVAGSRADGKAQAGGVEMGLESAFPKDLLNSHIGAARRIIEMCEGL